MTNETTQIEIGKEVKIENRSYTVEQQFPLSDALKSVSPWLVAQYGVKGARGAVALMQSFSPKAMVACFTLSRTGTTRVENFTSIQPVYGETLGYTIDVVTLLSAANR